MDTEAIGLNTETMSDSMTLSGSLLGQLLSDHNKSGVQKEILSSKITAVFWFCVTV